MVVKIVTVMQPPTNIAILFISAFMIIVNIIPPKTNLERSNVYLLE